MKRMRMFAFAVLITITSSVAAEELVVARVPFVSLSDIHFDPYSDPSLVDKLVAAEATQWDAIFQSSSITGPSSYGSDTNYPLLQSLLEELATRRPRFVIISGDFLGHDFPELFQRYSSDKSAQAYARFAATTVQFLAASLEKAFPGVPIYPALGNNDSDCGDYELTPNGQFLKVFTDAWTSAVGRSSSFAGDFPAGGYYWVDPPALRGTRIVVLNTVFFSLNYDNACGPAGADPGATQLTWLNRTLRSAARQNKRVWLLYHIPPGVNVYSTISRGGACPTPSMFWQSQYAGPFAALVAQYKPVIAASFAGHTHMDDFRVTPSATQNAGGFIHITPAVSPLFTNNPAYQVFSTGTNGVVSDFTSYFLPLGAGHPRWQQEYQFTTAYDEPSYSTDALRALIALIARETATRALYMKFYVSSNPNSRTITNSNWRAYWCGTQNLIADDFTRCLCVNPPPDQDLGLAAPRSGGS